MYTCSSGGPMHYIAPGLMCDKGHAHLLIYLFFLPWTMHSARKCYRCNQHNSYWKHGLCRNVDCAAASVVAKHYLNWDHEDRPQPLLVNTYTHIHIHTHLHGYIYMVICTHLHTLFMFSYLTCVQGFRKLSPS